MQVYTAARMLTNAKRTLAETAATALTAQAAIFANVHPDTVDTTVKQTLMIVHPVSFSYIYYQLCYGGVGDGLKHLTSLQQDDAFTESPFSFWLLSFRGITFLLLLIYTLFLLLQTLV